MGRSKTCGQGRGSAGPPGCCRPDGGNPALGRWGVVAVIACALVTVGLLMGRRHGGRGGDGRRGDGQPQLADRFAPPIGHLSSNDD